MASLFPCGPEKWSPALSLAVSRLFLDWDDFLIEVGGFHTISVMNVAKYHKTRFYSFNLLAQESTAALEITVQVFRWRFVGQQDVGSFRYCSCPYIRAPGNMECSYTRAGRYRW